jgi:hypothetical protein
MAVLLGDLQVRDRKGYVPYLLGVGIARRIDPDVLEALVILLEGRWGFEGVLEVPIVVLEGAVVVDEEVVSAVGDYLADQVEVMFDR